MTRKTAFFERWSWFKSNNLELALGTDLIFYSNVTKGLKLKVSKFCRLIPTFVEVTRKKLAGVNTETVHIDCEKGAQNNILANKIVT